MFLAAAVLATSLTVPFQMVNHIPVAKIPTDVGQLTMVVDTGSNSTLFAGRTQMFYKQVCVFSRVCVETQDVNSYVPMFRKLVHDKKMIVDGLLGNDVLDHYSSVVVDYAKHTITFSGPM